ncbi:MAG: outer membrane protein [Brevundimonas sp.]|uniref:outer membrane protein n=1 Tax=Brevundimonas sp. TaxID=1871086 RepID=UPI00391B9126
MLKYVIVAGAAGVAMLAAPASAQTVEQPGWYVQVGGGASINGEVDLDVSIDVGPAIVEGSETFDLDNGWLATAAIGRDNGRVRFEFEALYSDNDVADVTLTDGAETLSVDGVSVSQAAVFANVLIDFDNASNWTPYIGAGIGYGATRFTTEDDDEVDSGLAWQVKAGLSYQTASNVTWDIGYRYVNMADFEFSDFDGFTGSLSAEGSFHAVTVALRFGF